MTSSEKVLVQPNPHAKRLSFTCVVCHCCILKNVEMQCSPVFPPQVNRLSIYLYMYCPLHPTFYYIGLARSHRKTAITFDRSNIFRCGKNLLLCFDEDYLFMCVFFFFFFFFFFKRARVLASTQIYCPLHPTFYYIGAGKKSQENRHNF